MGFREGRCKDLYSSSVKKQKERNGVENKGNKSKLERGGKKKKKGKKE